jgi:Beta-lactamase
MAQAVARQAPMWWPGERHGYHGVSFGWLVGEPVRRLTNQDLAGFLAREVFDRLDIDGYMATPHGQQARVADLMWGRPAHGNQGSPPATAPGSAPTLAPQMYAPVLPPLAPNMNDPAFRSAGIPVTGAAMTARGFAVIYGELARDGGPLVSPAIARALGETQIDGKDAVLGIPVARTLGYELTPSWVDDGRPPCCWGSPGAGESGPRSSSHATRRAETVLPSTLSFPAPSVVREPVHRWHCPERSTLASKRVLSFSSTARLPGRGVSERGVTEGVRRLKCQSRRPLHLARRQRRPWSYALTRAFVLYPPWDSNPEPAD